MGVSPRPVNQGEDKNNVVEMKNAMAQGRKSYWRSVCVLALLIPTSLMVGCSTHWATEQRGLSRYYIDFADVAKNWDGVFDEDGIPMRDYEEFGVQYQPVGIAHYALGNWDLFLSTHDAKYKMEFLKRADWFCDHLVVKGDFGIWEYRFDYPRFHLKAPWPSAMSQGEGISVLTRAYQLTKKERYLKCAKMALASFRVPLEEGGVRYRDKEGFIWYEEYPSSVKPPHVLNGFIFALFGLYGFYELTGSGEAHALFNDGIDTLKANLGKWDLGTWSRYDLTDLYGKVGYTFRFVTDERHPIEWHPIDKIVLHTITDSGENLLTVLDVGSENDTSDVSVDGAHLYHSQEYQDWGDSYLLDGRPVRNYEDCGGGYAHAPFDFLVDLQPSNTYCLEITYKDVTNEPVYIEMYADGIKYIRFAKVEGEEAGRR